MKMKLKSLRRHVDIVSQSVSQSVSQESILHHSTKPASLLWLLLLSASFCLTPLFVHDLLFSPHVRFLMLVPKSGKAEGMTRPPSTSHLHLPPASPISPLPLDSSHYQYHDFVVQCNTYLYVWLLTWWFWPVLYVFVRVLWLTVVSFMSDFLLSVENKCCCVSCL